MTTELTKAAQQALEALDALIADPGEDRIKTRIWNQARASSDALHTAIQQAEAKTDEMGTLFVKGSLSGIVDAQVRDLWPTKSATHPAPGVPEDSELLDYLDTLAARPAGSDLHCLGGRVVLYVRTGISSQIEASGAGTAREALRAALAATQAKGGV